MSDSPYRIGVISDTHGRLPDEVFDLFKGVSLILHAGDIGREEIITDLEAVAPVKAVCGNCDFAPAVGRHPVAQRVETPLGKIAMTHGHLDGAPSTKLARMIKFFEAFAPSIIVYGHSHIPKLEEIGGVLFFNPGSAGQPRFGHGASVGLIEPGADGAPRLEHKMLKVR